MKKVIFLIGAPGYGKTTWRNSHYPPTCDIPVFSTDDYIEEVAIQSNMTYSDIFSDTISLAEKVCFDRLNKWIFNQNKIIIDRTNLTKSSRKRILEKFPSDFHKTAIVFPKPDDLYQRLKSRPNKFIPLNVVENMINKYEEPTKEEGFDDIQFLKKE